MDSNSRRLTRSTYIGEPASAHNRNTRSSSTDSENGWIPPPPLLPLATKFLITNPQPRSRLSRSLSPLNPTDPISTGIAIAHLKCQPSDSSQHSEILTTSFRLLDDHELVHPPLASHSNQQDDSADFIQAENRAFSRRHRQFEMIEKRSKKLEKEKLLHERFKLKNRLDILVKGSGADWKSVRTLTLRRIKEDELKERSIGNHQLQSDHQPRETEFEKVERMRHIMIQETEEILKRYDKLLDTRKTSSNKPRTGVHQSTTDGRPSNNQTSTPSHSQLKTTKHRSTPSSSKRKPTIQISSDPDHPHKSNKRSHRQTIPKLNIIESLKLQERDVPLNHLRKKTDLCHRTNGQLFTSNLSSVIPAESSESQHVQPMKTDDDERPLTCKPTTVPIRESLYDSASIRRSAMDEQLLNGKKRVGRSTYALGCRLPDLNEIQLDYLAEIQSMVPEKRASPHSTTPFDRPERRMTTHNRKSISSSTRLDPTIDHHQQQHRDEFVDHWIEFNPTVNEEKEIIDHQAEFGLQSKFFELDEELDYLEERKRLDFLNRLKSSLDHGSHPSTSHLDHLQFLSKNGSLNQSLVLGGKSIRKLIEERIQTWDH